MARKIDDPADMLGLFAGLDRRQSEELRRRIIGVLPELRRQVIQDTTPATGQQPARDAAPAGMDPTRSGVFRAYNRLRAFSRQHPDRGWTLGRVNRALGLLQRAAGRPYAVTLDDCT